MRIANGFAVWEYFSKDVEVAQGRNIADACKDAGVSHLVWSSLAHADKGKISSCCRGPSSVNILFLPVSNGELVHMKHFDSKAEVEEYIRELGVPATFFYAGCYMSNFPGALQKVTPAIVRCGDPS